MDARGAGADGGDGSKHRDGPGNVIDAPVVALSNANTLAPFSSTQDTIASSLLASSTPFDIDTVFCEIDVQKLPLFCSVVHVGGKLSHFTSQKELNTLPYLLVACHPPLFVKFANPPGGDLFVLFEEFRENLVRAFFPKIAMTCAERRPVEFNTYVESLSDRDHPYAVDAFVSILKSCEVTSLFYVHYNLKSPLADASKTYLTNLRVLLYLTHMCLLILASLILMVFITCHCFISQQCLPLITTCVVPLISTLETTMMAIVMVSCMSMVRMCEHGTPTTDSSS